jgi:hypothetical protein
MVPESTASAPPGAARAPLLLLQHELTLLLDQRPDRLGGRSVCAAARINSPPCGSPPGRLCMSNNAAERELRAVAMGRKNWTFAGSDEGGRRAAALLHADLDGKAQRGRSAGLAHSSRTAERLRGGGRLERGNFPGFQYRFPAKAWWGFGVDCRPHHGCRRGFSTAIPIAHPHPHLDSTCKT